MLIPCFPKGRELREMGKSKGIVDEGHFSAQRPYSSPTTY
jgi:hypothetical protein